MMTSAMMDDDVLQIIKDRGIKELLAEQLKLVPKVMFGKHQIMFDIEDPDEFLLQKAKEDLRETPEIVAQGLKELRELVAGTPDLHCIDSDEFYTIFLRPCKWYAQSAFSIIKRWFRFSQNYPHIFNDLKPSTDKENNAIYAGLVFPLPLRDTEGCRLFVVESGKRWKPKKISLDQIFKSIVLCVYAAMLEPKSQIAGGRAIIDFEGFSLSQVTYFTPSFAKMLADFIQKAIPFRIKSIHIVNQSFLFNMVFALFKPFLEEKFRKRIHFHGTDRESLMTFIDKSVLPKKYGGELDLIDYSFSVDLWQYFCKFDPLFIAYNKIGYAPKK